MHCTATARRLRRVCKRARAEHGFTIAELLVAMAILTIVMTALTSVLVTASQNELDANKRFRVQLQGRTGLAQLRRELHCASAVTDTSNAALALGTAYDAITVTLSSACPTSGGTTLYATWCTKAMTSVTGDYSLWRATSTTTTFATCTATTKTKWMSYLTTATPFCLPSSITAVPQRPCSVNVYRPTTASLPLLHVTMPLNLNGPSSTIDGYNLVDDIAFRNVSTRS